MRRSGSFLIVVAGALLLSLPVQAAELPAALSDQEFWQMVKEFSEPGGRFQQEFMTNEDSLQFVIPALKQMTRRGGVYIGVGPEQNFTYAAAIQPQMVFVVDIRRDNMIEHLMYKALFDLSADRAEFLSRLFSRKRPLGIDANSSVTALFEAYRSAEADPGLYEENLRVVLDHLLRKHKFDLTETDKASVGFFMNAFRTASAYGLRGSGDKNLTYAQSMAGTDQMGRNQSYLASEESFKFVQDLERRNLIVPLVGDFAGDKAIDSIGRYLRDHGATVDVFYVSNVERYLWEQGEHGQQFYRNAAKLPLGPSSTFIRSVTAEISQRLGIPIPDGNTNWRSFLSPMNELLKAFSEGRIRNYREVFDIPR